LLVELLYRIEACIHFRQCVKERRLRGSQISDQHACHVLFEKRCWIETMIVWRGFDFLVIETGSNSAMGDLLRKPASEK
jgi:hypothetical protein